MKGGTKEGAARAVETKRKEYGVEFFKENGAKGGKARNASPKKHLTFKDSDKASTAGAKGAEAHWAKYYAEKEVILSKAEKLGIDTHKKSLKAVKILLAELESAQE